MTDSYPEPAITWTLDGIQIESSDNKIMTLDNRLVVLDFRDEDQGPYRCEADNPLAALPHTSPAIMLFFTGMYDKVLGEGEALKFTICTHT